MNKKLLTIKNALLTGLLLVCSSSYAQYIGKCSDPKGNFIYCQMSPTPVPQPSLPVPDPSKGLDVSGIAAGAAPDLTQILKTPNVQGSYDDRYPGNIFAFCSGGRPGRHDPRRPIWDSICPKGKVSDVAP